MSFLLDEPWLLFLTVGILLFTSSAGGLQASPPGPPSRINDFEKHTTRSGSVRNQLQKRQRARLLGPANLPPFVYRKYSLFPIFPAGPKTYTEQGA
jgi:hypothetical protein